MIKPNYHDGSIVNLVASIGRGLGAANAYEPLPLLPPETVAEARNVVLLIIDGLGHDFLQRHPSHLARHLRGRITSVFPSSTAPAISSLVTGVAPQQHGVTGWFMQFREFGTVGMILPYRPRYSPFPFDSKQLPVENLLGQPSFFDGLDTKSHYLMHHQLVDSAYSIMAAGTAQRQDYQSLSDLFGNLVGIVRKGDNAKYIYSYWPMFDALAHRHGVDSEAVDDHFRQIDQEFQRCVEALAGTDTLLIVTADHGFIDTAPQQTLRLEHYPDIQECLSLPLCGEPRVAYCYVHHNRAADFERLVLEQLGHGVTLNRAEDLVAGDWFGLGTPSNRLLERIGDYVLICKDNHVIKDRLPMEQRWHDTGVHGGVSAREMYVPLLTASC